MSESRNLALNILSGYTPKESNLSILTDKMFSKTRAGSPVSKGFTRELVWWVVSRLNTLDYIISQLAKNNSRIDNKTNNILRLGICQLFYISDRVPAYAAVNESVALCGNNKKIKGFVNAVLWEFTRKKEDIIGKINKLEPVKRISLLYSHPEWMVARWIKRFGEAQTMDLCAANNSQGKLSIRVNTLKVTREVLRKQLQNEGFECEYARFSNDCLYFEKKPELGKLESYKKGFFTVQDESSQLVTQVLTPMPGEVILDLCCGSGTKTSYIAQITGNKSLYLRRGQR
jgi:16S rRNA (cytosine967-C5)-methyltransferase